jgi:uncharacterized protein with NRDE domain
MCTVVLSLRPSGDWPVVIGANRDEAIARAWDGPARHWPDRPGVIAGRDRSAGGTWLGVNRHGVVAAVLNRTGSLGPAPGKRSRGELPLLALDHASAEAAAQALGRLDGGLWRSFNMVIADAHGAWSVRSPDEGPPLAVPVAAGVHMVTAHDLDDTASSRIARHLPRFQAAPAPEPDDWVKWAALLADRSGNPGSELNISPRSGFGTICSSLLFIPRVGPVRWLFAAGPPDRADFIPVESA